MANEAKVKLDAQDTKTIIRALEAYKASMLRAKTKEAADQQMVEIYEARMRNVDRLIGDIANKELF